MPRYLVYLASTNSAEPLAEHDRWKHPSNFYVLQTVGHILYTYSSSSSSIHVYIYIYCVDSTTTKNWSVDLFHTSLPNAKRVRIENLPQQHIQHLFAQPHSYMADVSIPRPLSSIWMNDYMRLLCIFFNRPFAKIHIEASIPKAS